MEVQKIIEDDKGFYLAFIGTDFENQNPVEYYKAQFIRKEMILMRETLALKNAVITALLSDKFFRDKAELKWNDKYRLIKSTKIPGLLTKLLSTDKKHEQENYLKRIQLTPSILIAFIFDAFESHGFTLSQFTTEHLPEKTDLATMPVLAKSEDNNITVVGNTTMTDGEIKQVIEQRKVTVAKFLVSGGNWHCFFLTYRSLRGEETWKDGQAHFHYISDKWGMSKEDVIAAFKAGDYPPTSVHIPLVDYGNQSKK